MTPDLVYF